MFNFRPIPLGSIPEIEPVFVVGAARSGTTPLQLALNMHPELGVYGETQAFFVHDKFAAGPSEIKLRRLLAYWRVVLSGCCPYDDFLDNEHIQRRLAAAPTYAHILNVIMGAIAAREGKSRWGEKSPAHIFKLDEIRACFPNARIIHIVRDPRAVVCSTIKAFNRGQFSDWNIYSSARYWVRCLRAHARQVSTKADGYMLVHYEDFVTRPKETLTLISAFLGLKFVDEMLNAHRVAADYIRPDKSGNIPALHSLTQHRLDSGRTDAWKQILSPSQYKLIERTAGKQMATLGYLPARQEYSPPQMRVSFFLPRWAVGEGRRIVMKKIREPYRALRRVIDSQTSTVTSPEPGSFESSPLNLKPSVRQQSIEVAATEPQGEVRGSGT